MTTETRLFLIDDARARQWAPFATTRPVGELRYGVSLLRERVEHRTGLACVGHVTGPHLEGWDEPGAPPALARIVDAGPPPFLAWNSRAVPDAPVSAVAAPEPSDRAIAFVIADRVAGVYWPGPESPGAGGDPLDPPDGAVRRAIDGEWLDWPWTLVDRNPARLASDLETAAPTEPPHGVVRIGDGTLSMHPSAELEAGVTVDTRDGPVRLDEGVRVEGPGRLVGPLHLAAGTVVFGGSVARSSVGPVCKVRGEVDGCVFLGFANKAHDGYLGHALVGRWVNLGALTTNSDLKNSYSPVRVELPHGNEDTGLVKVGVFLGDHVKTGIGTLLTTGAVVGAASNLFGGGTPPRAVAPFSWLGPDGAERYRFDKFVDVARTAMARRRQELTGGVRAVLERAAGDAPNEG